MALTLTMPAEARSPDFTAFEFRAALDKICEELSAKIARISVSLTAQYFSHTTYQAAEAKDNFKLEI